MNRRVSAARAVAVSGTFLILVGVLPVTLAGQSSTRRLTTVDALRQFPGFFHLQPVLVHGELAETGGHVILRADEHELRVMMGGQHSITGPAEVRGQLIDVGRLQPGDPRLSGYGEREEERWPKPGEELVLNVTGISSAQPLTTPTLRALALEPWRFEGQKVTVVGQFRGRNLFGDLPAGPSLSKFYFVLRSSDAAVWITGLRPRGKGFDLDVDARVDTAQWLEVTGLVKSERGLVTIGASTIALTTEPKLTTEPEEPVAPPPPAEPVEVVFSSPTEGETDVALNSPVRIQFSRSIDPKTLDGRLRVGYFRSESTERGEAQPPAIKVHTTYDPGSRALELKFSKALERFRTVRVELLEGIKAFDGAAVKPWALTFSLGG
jgi:hypothetical protein